VKEAKVFTIDCATYKKLVAESLAQKMKSIFELLKQNNDDVTANKLIKEFKDGIKKDRLTKCECSHKIKEHAQQPSGVFQCLVVGCSCDKFKFVPLGDNGEIENEFQSWIAQSEVPSEFPFPSNLYLASGDSRMGLGEEEQELYNLHGESFDFGLFTSPEICCAIVAEPTVDGYRFHAKIERVADEWNYQVDVAPILEHVLIKIVTEHKDLVKKIPRSFVDRKAIDDFKKETKQKFATPNEFYEIKLSSTYVDQERRNLFPKPRNWTHRWDVVGNRAIRYHHGPMPLDAKLEKNFLKRGYKIFMDGQLFDEATAELMGKREIEPPPSGEWLAVLSWWRKSHLKGPDDKPYVPAIRDLSQAELPS